jgi:hypothetical protein
MEAVPSFQNNPQGKKIMKPMKIKHGNGRKRRQPAAAPTKKTRQQDPVYFKDISYASDYKKWLEPSIDPSIVLAVKGPYSQLYFKFEKDSDGQVVTSTRAFGSAADAEVPIILPDLKSSYYKKFPAATATATTPRELRESALIGDVEDLDADGERAAVEAFYGTYHIPVVGDNPLDEEQEQEVNSLGLKAFNIINTEEKLGFSISQGTLDPSTLEIADFSEEHRAIFSYSYANTILNSNEYRQDTKDEIEDWLTTMPPGVSLSLSLYVSHSLCLSLFMSLTLAPDKGKGFMKGSAKRYITDYKNGLESVVALSRQLRRPDPSAYHNVQNVVRVQDSLQSIPHRLMAHNSETAGDIQINKLIMQATMQDSAELAKKVVIQQYLEEEKKAKQAAKIARAAAKAARAAAKAAGSADVTARSTKKPRRRQQVSSTAVSAIAQTGNDQNEDMAGDKDDEDQSVEDDGSSDDDEDDDADEDHWNDNFWDDDDQKPDEADDYWTDLTLQAAEKKKYKQLNITTQTVGVSVNVSIVQVKSDANIPGIRGNSFGLVTGDVSQGRERFLTVQFLQNESRVLSYRKLFLLEECA